MKMKVWKEKLEATEKKEKEIHELNSKIPVEK